MPSRPLLVVVLIPTPDVAVRRDAERGYNAYQPERWDVEDLDRALRHETPRLGVWIDNSNQDPAETVDDILRLWDEAVMVSP